jgi:hypothetical protein
MRKSDWEISGVTVDEFLDSKGADLSTGMGSSRILTEFKTDSRYDTGSPLFPDPT